jgi:hypothetical protein
MAYLGMLNLPWMGGIFMYVKLTMDGWRIKVCSTYHGWIHPSIVSLTYINMPPIHGKFNIPKYAIHGKLNIPKYATHPW